VTALARALGAAILAALVLVACAPTREPAMLTRWPTLGGAPPLVIAHRGASCCRPEHTLEAYRLAIAMGADVIEPDLVFTRDGVLVARHDRYLSTTTDVADRPEFAARRRPNDDAADAPREDWWVEDFTLAEIRTLRARQPFAGRSAAYDGLYPVATLDEIVALVREEARRRGRSIGLYPETKHPGFFAAKGLAFAPALLAALEGFDAGPVFIQSFEPEILQQLKGRTPHALVLLVDAGDGADLALADIAAFADGVGPAKGLIIAPDGTATDFIARAHALGLFVHAWTFRDDAPNPAFAGKTPAEELQSFFALGLDGAFADFPETALRAREAAASGAAAR